MADRSEQVSTTGLVDTKQQPSAAKRRQYSEALKRQMVAETQAPGASVSVVARRHDVNSNQLFRWRRQLLPKAAVESGAMVPVEIAPDGGRPSRPQHWACQGIVPGGSAHRLDFPTENALPLLGDAPRRHFGQLANRHSATSALAGNRNVRVFESGRADTTIGL